MTCEATISLASAPGREGTSIVVNGQDITEGVSSVTITGSVFGRTQAVITVPLVTVGWANGEAVLHLSDDSRTALLAFGWTPPEEERDVVHSAAA